MYTIIVGLGGIGRNLTAIAVNAGDSVVVIDQNEERASDILEHYDVLAITGNATDKSVLEDAGIDRADALVATTSDDAGEPDDLLARERYNVRNVVSIVNQKEHSDLFNEVGVKISGEPGRTGGDPALLLGKEPEPPAGRLDPGGTIFEIVAEAGAPIVDREIRELDVRDFVFIAIRRAGGDLIIPSGAVRIRPGDVITVFTKKRLRGRRSRPSTSS